ncbi:MAG: phosphate signaling complex protein PhoU [Terriglobales bacterium]
MRKHFAEELEDLKERVVYMGGLVETAVHRSVHAFVDRDLDLSASVIREIEPEVNHLEVEIDEEILRLLALQQPMAVDLRFLAACLKITTDLERMGDLAVNIAQGVERLLEQPLSTPLVDLPLMAERTKHMIRTALDSLIGADVGLARQVLETDDEVDSIRDQIFRELMHRMGQNSELVERGMTHILVARNLERIADHATNIAEDVIFWVEGVDIRHHLHDHV